MHALNQLECIDWLIEKNEDFSNPKRRIQEFLIKKLNLKTNAYILQEKYKKFWENEGFDDSLDEMTVILGSKRRIDLTKTVFIGETTFLREYYDDDSIISWSYYSTNDIDLWQNSSILLDKSYVNNVQEFFFFMDKIQEINYREIIYKK